MKMAPVILSQHYTEILADDGTRSNFLVIAIDYEPRRTKTTLQKFLFGNQKGHNSLFKIMKIPE